METAFQVDVDIVSDRDLYLSDTPSREGEVGRVLLADRIPGVATDAQPFAGERKLTRLGTPWLLSDCGVVDVQGRGADRLIVRTDTLLGELDSKDVRPRPYLLR